MTQNEASQTARKIVKEQQKDEMPSLSVHSRVLAATDGQACCSEGNVEPVTNQEAYRGV